MKLYHRIYSLACFIFIVLLLSGCYKEYYDVIDPEKDVFKFIVTPEQEEYIRNTFGNNFVITDPKPILHIGDDEYTIDKFEARGDGTMNFVRKGLGINMDRKLTVYIEEEQAEKQFEEYKMLALVYDYTYIENSVAVGFFKEVELWPVTDFFTEVRFNNHTQGLYHFLEDPFEYFIEQESASFILRRGYWHSIKSAAVSQFRIQDSLTFINRFNSIYPIILNYNGQELYDRLSDIMDLEQYFTKLSIDLLLKNGDYTDEVIFYTKIKNDKEVFGVFPWDYDDLFADQPHEIGRSWALTDLFGTRIYNNMEDIIADVSFKLLFSIEEDLDYKIAKDSFLYQEYLKTLSNVMEHIDNVTIDKVFDETYEQISPFYENDSIIAQSRYDVDETNRGLFLTNIAQKRQLIKERRAWIVQQLDNQK
jgi:spore coat protein H